VNSDERPTPAADPLAVLREQAAVAAASAAGLDAAPAGVAIDAPRQPEHGDYALNAAMVCAKPAGVNPRELAQAIVERLGESLDDELATAEIAGPGFINLRMSDAWYGRSLAEILTAARFGAGVAEQPQSVNVEFVSANPTGPMHIGHGRNAAYGDSLCRILDYAGHAVTREFYVNDFGSQVLHFGESIQARARGAEVHDEGYQGAYVQQVADAIDGAAEMEDEELARRGVEHMLGQVRDTLGRMRVSIDVWFSERTLQHEGNLQRTLDQLAVDGHTYERDDALWLRTTDFGDDKDRVLRRSSGEYTYFATDIAYHADKLARGFDHLIDVWGADHHGYIARMKAAIATQGADPDRFEPVIMQLVNLTEGGERVQMSKRSGEFVTVDDLLDDIGPDALRFFLVQRSHDTAMDLDLELAREQSDKNPVYYVQYAHARICSILRKAGDSGDPARQSAEPYGELHASERALVRRLLDFPSEIAEAALRRGPHRLTVYSRDLAAEFAAFYRDCSVLGAERGAGPFRLALCVAARDVLATALDLLGVEAPDQM
jgi:arginyl-tRNA synthetase